MLCKYQGKPKQHRLRYRFGACIQTGGLVKNSVGKTAYLQAEIKKGNQQAKNAAKGHTHLPHDSGPPSFRADTSIQLSIYSFIESMPRNKTSRIHGRLDNYLYYILFPLFIFICYFFLYSLTQANVIFNLFVSKYVRQS